MAPWNSGFSWDWDVSDEMDAGVASMTFSTSQSLSGESVKV